MCCHSSNILSIIFSSFKNSFTNITDNYKRLISATKPSTSPLINKQSGFVSQGNSTPSHPLGRLFFLYNLLYCGSFAFQSMSFRCFSIHSAAGFSKIIVLLPSSVLRGLTTQPPFFTLTSGNSSKMNNRIQLGAFLPQYFSENSFIFIVFPTNDSAGT